jgi:SAM-dependent methyltransferase
MQRCGAWRHFQGDPGLYSENRAKDVVLFAKAVLSNQLARVAPAIYMRLTHETGRGEEEQTAEQIAAYFTECFHDYHAQLGIDAAQFDSFLTGKRVLEYGPGDTLGVALLMYAHGAEVVDCFDRFSLHAASDKSLRVYDALLASLNGDARQRAAAAFVEPGRPASGFNPSAIRYHVTADGLSGATKHYDLIVSRAVLEHVGNLEFTLRDVANALKPDGISIHEVDLRSHGLDRYQPFDFLTWPEPAYRMMFSHKGFPNRWRLNKYRDLFERVGLHVRALEPTTCLKPEQVARVEPHLCHTLRGASHHELAWMGFWVILEPVRASATVT